MNCQFLHKDNILPFLLQGKESYGSVLSQFCQNLTIYFEKICQNLTIYFEEICQNPQFYFVKYVQNPQFFT